MKDVSVGIIGFGNMGSAMAKGWLAKEVLRPDQLHVCAKDTAALRRRAPEGVLVHEDAATLVAASDVVVLAVKPHLLEQVVAPVASLLRGRLVWSVVAGWHHERLVKQLGSDVHVLSTIPNTPIAVGEGLLIAESHHSLTDSQLTMLMGLVDPVAHLVWVETSLLSVAGTLGGCSPAFAAMFMEALGDAGVKYGLSRQVAYDIAAQMMRGTAALLLEEGMHPGVLKDGVCSPKGTTIRGVSALEKAGFRGAILSCIDAIEGNEK